MSQTRVELKFSNTFEGELTTARGTASVGQGEGQLRPYDMLLGALGTCFYATFLDIARKMRLEYESAAIDITGVKREEVPTTLSTVDMIFTISGAGDQKGFQRAAELAARYCSVHETVSKVATIRLDLRFA